MTRDVPPDDARPADDRPAAVRLTALRGRCAARATILLLALVAAAPGGLALSTSPAAAANSTDYGIRPADAADHFRMELAPGAASRQRAIVSNRSRDRVTFKVYAADALTTKQGGFALRSRAEPRAFIGKWAQLPFQTVTINPGTQRDVPFRLNVPAGATPGDYAGGIILEAPPRQGKPGDVGNQTAVQLNVVERVGVRVYLKVAGTPLARLYAGRLTVQRKNDAVALALPMRNTGNVILRPAATATVNGWVGGGRTLTFTGSRNSSPDRL